MCKHSILNANCPDCQALQAHWYQKLDQDQEIEDIRSVNGKVTHIDNEQLKVWHNHYFISRHEPEQIAATTEYFQQATSLLHNFKFETITHKRIWKLHSLGFTKRSISDELAKSTKYTHYKPTQVLEIISRIKKYL